MNAVKIVKKSNVKLTDEDLTSLLEIVRLEKKGIYYDTGRTCYYQLKKPVIIGNKKYTYLKIKGSGVLENDKVNIFSDKEFSRVDPHYGFDTNDNPILVKSKPAPYGGILLDRAINEFNNFTLLISSCVSSLYPLYVFEYKNLKFYDQKLGVIVALSEEPYRFNKILFHNIPDNYIKFYKNVFYNEFGYNTDFSFEDKTKLIQRLAYKYAREVKKMAECGLFIHSGGWSNIQYSFSDKNIVLVDLDSSLKNKLNKNILKYRDLISNIYRLFINLYNPNCIQDYNEKIIKENNYCYYLLDGYFDGIINSEFLIKISNKINDYFINNCFNNIKKIENIMNYISDQEVKKMELNIFEFYSYCMCLINDMIEGGD